MILIISSLKDPHAVAVASALAARGRPHHVLDLSEFPMAMDLGISMATGAPSRRVLRLASGTRIDIAEVTAVWWRRPQPYGLPPEMTDPVSRSFAHQECDLALRGLWQTMRALWINDPVRDAAASHKPWQLDIAREIGLAIPHTLITNVPEEADRFAREAGGPVIYKAFLANAMAWRETRVLTEADRAKLPALRYAPAIFQNYVEAVRDLRVTVVGDRTFAAGAETARGAYPADIRMNTAVAWAPVELPAEVERKLHELRRRLGLEYGAIDLRETPEGEHVFLEINTAGQFLFIEQVAGLPIAAALAEHLASAAPTA